MSTTTADAKALAHAQHRRNSLHRQRLWALWGSYIALGFFVVIFLVPPFYTLMTSLKSSAEISAQTGSPWLVHHPTLENFWYLITYPNFQTYYLNSVMITIAPWRSAWRSPCWPRSAWRGWGSGAATCSAPACS